MGIHDFGDRYDIFHDLRFSWILHVSRAINRHAPEKYYSLVSYFYEHLGTRSDTLNPATDYMTDWEDTQPDHTELEYLAARANVATVRSVNGHRLVALADIVSPGIKSSRRMMTEHVRKYVSLIRQGIHVLVIDPLPPGPYDENGVHGEIWKLLSDDPYIQPDNAPLTLVSYRAAEHPEAFVEPTAVGRTLIDMPLFYDFEHYVSVPLDATYATAWDAVPAYWRDRIAGSLSLWRGTPSRRIGGIESPARYHYDMATERHVIFIGFQ